MGYGTPLYIGIDPTTGYRVFVDPPSTRRLELPECPCCLKQGALADTRKFEGQYVCKDCGKAWTNYKAAKRRATQGCSERTLQTYSDWIDHWITIRNGCGLAPRDLDDSLEALQRYRRWQRAMAHQAELQRLATVEMVTVKCVYCGEEWTTEEQHKERRCPACASRYARYKRLQINLGRLTLEQCDEMEAVLNEYKGLMLRGYWAPNLKKYRKLIAARRECLVDADV